MVREFGEAGEHLVLALLFSRLLLHLPREGVTRHLGIQLLLPPQSQNLREMLVDVL